MDYKNVKKSHLLLGNLCIYVTNKTQETHIVYMYIGLRRELRSPSTSLIHRYNDDETESVGEFSLLYQRADDTLPSSAQLYMKIHKIRIKCRYSHLMQRNKTIHNIICNICIEERKLNTRKHGGDLKALHSMKINNTNQKDNHYGSTHTNPHHTHT